MSRGRTKKNAGKSEPLSELRWLLFQLRGMLTPAANDPRGTAALASEIRACLKTAGRWQQTENELDASEAEPNSLADAPEFQEFFSRLLEVLDETGPPPDSDPWPRGVLAMFLWERNRREDPGES